MIQELDAAELLSADVADEERVLPSVLRVQAPNARMAGSRDLEGVLSVRILYLPLHLSIYEGIWRRQGQLHFVNNQVHLRRRVFGHG